uniref:Uncharacterized protein n=1 Tax=Pectobacterium carotovorum TaxID=554 RepID=A0A0K0MQ02_PECCA|nr:hypothetical protein [Pectobacterium carotovorum]AKG47527.1 hypothetical protein pA_00087 [Pectobacterium carotovorum]
MSDTNKRKQAIVINALKLSLGGMASMLGVMTGMLVATLGSPNILHIVSNLGCSLVGFYYVYSGFKGMVKIANEVQK